MLINTSGVIKWNDKKASIKLQFPVIFLDNFNYNISVRLLHIDSEDSIPDNYFSLQSTAIDKNNINPNQEIYSFRSTGSNYIFNEPSQKREYKIQLRELHTSEFVLTSLKPVNLSLSKIDLIFEIIRDARIQ